MSDSKPNEIALPTDAIPALRTTAEGLSKRLGRPLNYAQTYVALSSARASGELDPIGCRDFIEHAADPRLIETVATLLEQNLELLEELQNKPSLQGFD